MGSLVQAPQISDPEIPYRDCCVTLFRMLEDHKSVLGLKVVFDYDAWLIPRLPAAAVEFVKCDERVPILGIHQKGSTHMMTYDFTLTFNIWYYHEKISQEIHEKDMETVLNNINNEIFKTHPTINGYACPGYSHVEFVSKAAREREECTLFGGYITVIIPRRACYEHDPNVVAP